MTTPDQDPGPVVLRNPTAGEVVHLHPPRPGAGLDDIAVPGLPRPVARALFGVLRRLP